MTREEMIDKLKTEPNHDIFISFGMICEIFRHPEMGHLCGYVYTPPQHPWFEKDYDYIDVSVHGGLTHAVLDDGMWRLGFDAAHYGDAVPRMVLALNFPDDGEYRDWEYVRQEVDSLAYQANLVSPETKDVDFSSYIAKKYLSLKGREVAIFKY